MYITCSVAQSECRFTEQLHTSGANLHRKLPALHVHRVCSSEESRKSIRVKRSRHDDEPKALWPGAQHATEQAKQHVRVHRALMGFVNDNQGVPAHAFSAQSAAVRPAPKRART